MLKRILDHTLARWMFIAIIAAGSVWVDYYHPIGILFDAIILVVLFVKWNPE